MLCGIGNMPYSAVSSLVPRKLVSFVARLFCRFVTAPSRAEVRKQPSRQKSHNVAACLPNESACGVTVSGFDTTNSFWAETETALAPCNPERRKTVCSEEAGIQATTLSPRPSCV
jgi:hypothetical protein